MLPFQNTLICCLVRLKWHRFRRSERATGMSTTGVGFMGTREQRLPAFGVVPTGDELLLPVCPGIHFRSPSLVIVGSKALNAGYKHLKASLSESLSM